MAAAAPAAADERLCDPAFEDCRAPLIDLIRNERTGIDVAFWFMEDRRYAAELIKRFQAGVTVRVIVDPRANATYPLNADILDDLRAARMPMRRKSGGGVMHWKMMLFAGQKVVEFSGANYSPNAFVPVTAYDNYVDEAIYFTNDAAVVASFETRFDDLWTNTSAYVDYANITSPPARRYPISPIAAELNFAPREDYAARAVRGYNAESRAIDATMFRITDRRHTDALLAGVRRGVRVRLITEPEQYRDPDRLWHAWNVDRLHQGGVEVRHRAHAGLNHQKTVILRGQRLSIYGSSNWTSPSASSQEEHNYFTTKAWFFDWLDRQFDRKWRNATGHRETEPFTPLPPDRPRLVFPAADSVSPAGNAALIWSGGPWAHVYDVYIGTNPSPPLVAAGVELGPSLSSTPVQQFAVSPLTSGTTYYWRVVSRTMADRSAEGPVWSFRTGDCASIDAPSAIDLPAAGGSGSISVSASGACNWRASGHAAWIVVTSRSYFTGSGTVRYSAPRNTGAARSAILAVAGRPITIVQAGVAPAPSPSPDGGEAPPVENEPTPTGSSIYNLAEGATGSFFDLDIALANPGASPAAVRLLFMREDGTTAERTVQVPAGVRQTVRVDDIEGHNSFGVTDPALRWGFAEGRVGGGEQFETYILVANPTTAGAEVRVRFLRASGSNVVKTFAVAPTSRLNIHVNGVAPELANDSFGAVVESLNGVPIIVERAMYWNALGRFWTGGTNVAAVPF